MENLPLRDPELKDRGGDISKRWYIKYWYYSTSEDKVVSKRIGEIKGTLSPNRQKTKSKRYYEFGLMKDAIVHLLKIGWTPEKQLDPDFITQKILGVDLPQESILSIKHAIDKTIEIRPRLEGKLNHFKRYLEENNLSAALVTEIKRSTITAYLRHVHNTCGAEGGKGSSKTRNNYLGDLHTAFEILVVEDILMKNPCKGIPKLKEVVERNVQFTDDQMKDIGDWCNNNDQSLKDFIYFIGYAFLRPKSIIQLQVKDINLREDTIYLRAGKEKTQVSHTVRIVDRLRPVIERLIGECSGADDYLFRNVRYNTPVQRTDYFARKFTTCKSELEKLKGYEFTPQHELYGVRHTFARDLYRSFRKTMKKNEALEALRPLMRHISIETTNKYVRDFSLELPDEWDHHYSIDF